MSFMMSIALRAPRSRNSPKLRLVPKRGHATTAPGEEQTRLRAALAPPPSMHEGRPSDENSPVLVAGRDPAERAAVLDSLAESMPERTLFQEVGTFWEVLIRAPLIRMVVISGELDGIPAESLLHMLGRRHPGLPVISLDPAA